MADPLFLGLDLSTQQLKAILITSSDTIIHETAVHFDNDLPHFNTKNGAIHSETTEGEVTVPVVMWLQALDLLFARMKERGVDFSKVKAIGGSAQQHGSVYTSSDLKNILSSLSPDKPLADQLGPNAFSTPNAPIWQDSSTSAECALLTEALGGAQQLADLSGSRAYERFTGVQIMKIYRNFPDIYSKTAHVHLISSFLSTIFRFASTVDHSSTDTFPVPIEASDASGMNLMNVLTNKWDPSLLLAIAPDGTLLQKLGGEPVEGGTSLGSVGNYFQQRWGLPNDCLISPFTGDNPATVVSLSAAPGSALLSLGTSTTFLLSLPPSPSPPRRTTTSHLLAHPTQSGGGSGIIMLCYKNGALAREAIRDEFAKKSWDEYNGLVQSTPPGNGGKIGLYYPLKEIIPPNVQGRFFFHVSRQEVKPIDAADIPPEIHPRAILESQLLSIKARLLDIIPTEHNETLKLSRVLVTGGSAQNHVIQQIVADILNLPVFVSSSEGTKEAAALGGALLGKWVWWRLTHPTDSFEEMAKDLGGGIESVMVAEPLQENATVYETMVEAYGECEEIVLRNVSTA